VTGPLVAYAVVRDDPPAVFLAEDLEVLQRALALHLVGRTDPQRVSAELDELRSALLEERWGDAVYSWIRITGVPIDVYTERIKTADDLPAEMIGMQLQFAPLFRD
jgi:hypothetical protein